MIEFGARRAPGNGSPSLYPAPKGPRPATNLSKITRHTMPSNFPANSLKTNDGRPNKVTHKLTRRLPLRNPVDAVEFSPVGAWHAMPGNRPWLDRAIRRLAKYESEVTSNIRALAIFTFLFSIFCAHPTAAQTAASPGLRDELWNDLREFVETPSVSGYEQQLTEKIRAKLTAFHPVVDNLGDVIVTIGSGTPRRLIVTPMDEPGFVVSGITDDGYLRLQRLPSSGLPPIFNELYSAQPVKVGTTAGKWIDGVVAGLSIHLQGGRANPPKSSDIDNMYLDIGASSAAEVRKAGVDILSLVAIDRRLGGLGDTEIAGASVGDK